MEIDLKEHIIVLPQKMYKVRATSRRFALNDVLKLYAKMVRSVEGFADEPTLDDWHEKHN